MSRARVAIGVPVYNGAETLAEALDSLLAQRFADFRIIISDNGSTDATAAIAAEYVQRDRRVEVHRVEQNRGAIWNFNRVFELGRDAEYFCWSAHDDLRAPGYLAACVARLDADPAAALCHSQIVLEQRRRADAPVVEAASLVLDSPSARARFAATLDGRPWHLLAYALMRTATIARTQVYRNFVGADLGFITELSLYGTFLQVPEPLFTYRLASDETLEDYFQRLQQVLDPSKQFGKLQSYRLGVARGHVQSIRRSPLSSASKVAAVIDLVRRFALSAGTADELLRIATSIVGPRRVEQLRSLRRRLRQR